MFRPKTGINGSWGSWGSWSTCGSDCRRSRVRGCDDPTPLFGGQDCQGNSSEKSSSTCYGDDCCPGERVCPPAPPPPGMMILSPSDTSDYLGCYKRYGGVSRALKFFRGTLTPCLCVAYCASLNYSLAGLSYGYIYRVIASYCHSVIVIAS